MGSFANPQDFLLHFRQALETALNSKVATSIITPHDGHRIAVSIIPQVFESTFGSTLRNDGRLRSPSRCKCAEELPHPGRCGERELHCVCVPRHEGKIFYIFGCHRCELNVTFGQVDALSPQFHPSGRAWIMRTVSLSSSIPSIFPPIFPSSNQINSPGCTSRVLPGACILLSRV